MTRRAKVLRVLRTTGIVLLGLVALAVGAFYAFRLPPSPPVDHLRGRVISHRGERAHAPENTLEAIRVAHEQGASIVEIDVVATTSDGVPVLMHDCTVDRTTSGHGNIGWFTLSEIQALDVEHADPRFANARVPTLVDALDLIESLGLAVEIEIKLFDLDPDEIVAQVADAIRDRDLYNRVHVASFYPDVLYRLRARDPRIIVAYLVHPEATGNGVVDGVLQSDLIPAFLGAGLVRPYRTLVDRAYVERHQAAGRVVNIWVVNDARERAWATALGASYSTDCVAAPCPSWSLGADGDYACLPEP